jgi:hypothetical protein
MRGRLAEQTRTLAAYLETHGSISNHMAIYEGVRAYGVFTRVGAHIFDFQAQNYAIKIEKAAATPATSSSRFHRHGN